LEIAKVTEQTDERKIRRIIDRVFDPADNEIFYHYCSNETLRLICQNKTLRLSDVNMLNDYAESRWGYHIFEQAASYLLQREQEMPLGITAFWIALIHSLAATKTEHIRSYALFREMATSLVNGGHMPMVVGASQ
jgi:hypothetical protein